MKSHCCWLIISQVYIPLCLYFNVGGIGRHARFKLLYIPLCLYFNCSTNVIPDCTITFTFHYVSILIKRRRTIDYFPYFLYIPLCLYFNVWCYAAGSGSIHFTFHYVSILIQNLPERQTAQNPFTFHYVSILICSFSDAVPADSALHSIMSLF